MHYFSRLELAEDRYKKYKEKTLEHLSGEVIPTMMAEMGLSHLKTYGWIFCRC